MSVKSPSNTHIGHAPASNLNKGYQNDTLDPYFMHPNENHALMLAIPLLNAENYHFWSRSMTMALRSKRKLHFINGILPRPPIEDRDCMSWLNNFVMEFLRSSCGWKSHQAYGKT